MDLECVHNKLRYLYVAYAFFTFSPLDEGPGFESLRMLWKTPEQVISNIGEGHVFHGSGIFGGYPGNSGYRHNLHKTNMKQIIDNQLTYPASDGDPEDSEISEHVKAEHVQFDNTSMVVSDTYIENDLYLSVQRGGSGLGDPLERDPAAIENDLDEKFLLPRFAEGVYGAVFTQDEQGKYHVDVAATEQRRLKIRQQRSARAIPTSEYFKTERERIINIELFAPVKEMYQSSMELSSQWATKFRSFWNLPDDFNF